MSPTSQPFRALPQGSPSSPLTALMEPAWVGGLRVAENNASGGWLAAAGMDLHDWEKTLNLRLLSHEGEE